MTPFISRIVNLLLRVVFLVVGMVFVASVVVLGLMLAAFVVVSSLLRGRKPVLNGGFAGDPRAAWARFRPRSPAPASTRRPVGEIVDVEVRDVTPVR